MFHQHRLGIKHKRDIYIVQGNNFPIIIYIIIKNRNDDDLIYIIMQKRKASRVSHRTSLVPHCRLRESSLDALKCCRHRHGVDACMHDSKENQKIIAVFDGFFSRVFLSVCAFCLARACLGKSSIYLEAHHLPSLGCYALMVNR